MDLMNTRLKKIKQARQALALAILGAGIFGLAGIVMAGETVKFKESESSFYSDLFDQSVYSEGVNQISNVSLYGKRLLFKQAYRHRFIVTFRLRR